MKVNYAFLSCALLTASVALAQVPNGSFESWSSTDPDNWETSNTNSNSNIISVSKVNTAKAGSTAMKLATWSTQGYVFPPVAICPRSNSFFVYAGHPTMITGWYMANLVGGDQMVVTGALVKANNTIGGGITYTSTSTSVYKLFQLPLYYTSQLNSDSATVMLTLQSQNGGGTNLNAASYIIVDDLQFSNGSPTGIEDHSLNKTLRISQDRQNGTVRITYDITQSGQVNIAMYDLQGKLIKTMFSQNQEAGTYRIDHLASETVPGVYLVKLESPEGVAVGKIITVAN